MFRGSAYAIGFVLALLLRIIFVPAIAAFFGSAIGFIFPATTAEFVYRLGFNSLRFWQVAVIVSSIGLFWHLSSPITPLNTNIGKGNKK